MSDAAVEPITETPIPRHTPPEVASRVGVTRTTAFGCRALDLVVATVLLAVLAVPILVIAIIIKLDSRGGALFRQERLGRNLRPFVVNKFRTMHVGTNADEHRQFVHQLIAGDAVPFQSEHNQSLFKIAVDERVTRVGRILRRTSLDELPQLLNVVRGDMSLVGPRPPLDYEVEKYPDRAFGRFAVKPGITGWWQVNGRSELSFVEMIDLDLEYAEAQTFWFNVKILLRTVPVVLGGKGAA